MEISIPYYMNMTIRMIRINNYAVSPPYGPFEILPVLSKGVVQEPEEKLSIFGTTESDYKFGHGDCYTILNDHKNDSDK